ncbi:MAG: hypothetical protein ABIJ61_04595 [bacterium]
MSVGKLAIVTIGIVFAGLFLAGCEGDAGPEGPPGLVGPPGPSGGNRLIPVPADRTFGIQVFNSTAADYRGVGDLDLSFAFGATPSATQVVGALLEKAPVLDGVDGGAAEWGAAVTSAVALGQIEGSDNGIDQALVRFGYDLDYIYAQVVWTEVATGTFVAAPDTTKNMWTRSGNNWTRSGGEDRLWLSWDAVQAGAATDVWAWHSTETGYTTHLRDMVIWPAEPEVVAADAGHDCVLANVNGSVPLRMRKNSLTSGSTYPLRSFEATTYRANLGWQSGATIPGYVFSEPTGSLADVEASARFDNGTWTLELRRARNTGSQDDGIF